MNEQDKYSVFISYRVNPDTYIATALKELIESSIDPTPKVFVSGVGGLLPSNKGFKPQIRDAVQSAKAFVAVITPSSKDREWIFYEAGAAWGRDQLYAPLLVDADFSDLSSSISNYQAVRSKNKDDVERLIYAIAQHIGAEKKSHFHNKYKSFLRKIEKVNEDDSDKEDNHEYEEALIAAFDGDSEKSINLFNKIIEDEKDEEKIAEAQWYKIYFNNEDKSVALRKYKALEETLGSTLNYNFCMGGLEINPKIKMSYYQKCISFRGNISEEHKYIKELAQIRYARQMAELDNVNGALKIIKEMLRSDIQTSRVKATIEWLSIEDYRSDTNVYENLILTSAAHLEDYKSTELLRKLSELCREQKWIGLFLGFSNKLAENVEDINSLVLLGLAYSAVSLQSSAYSSYKKAMELGSYVATANAANLFLSGGVASAGLELIRDFDGEVDSADPGYPFQTRAKMERDINNEMEISQKIIKNSKRATSLIGYFGMEARKSVKFKSGNCIAIHQETGKKIEIESTNNELTVTGLLDEEIIFEMSSSVIILYSSKENQNFNWFICLDEKDKIFVLKLDLQNKIANSNLDEYSIQSESSVEVMSV